MKIYGNPRRQRGVALLMILAIAGILAVVLVGNTLIRKHTEQERLAVTQAALAQAKEALIAYAVARMDRDYDGAPDVPGHLPCPSVSLPGSPNEEGNEEPSCSAENVTVVGRLPWKSLGIAPPRDGSGECLWYAVSGRFKNNPRGDIVNWDTEGHIRVLAPNGQVIANKVAAVIFAPGPALGQTRVRGTRAGYPSVPADNMPTCPGSYTPADYLEELRDAANNLIASNRTMATNTITGAAGHVDRDAGRRRSRHGHGEGQRSNHDDHDGRDLRGRERAQRLRHPAARADEHRRRLPRRLRPEQRPQQGMATLDADDRRMPLPAALSQVHVVASTPGLRYVRQPKPPPRRSRAARPRARHASGTSGLRGRRTPGSTSWTPPRPSGTAVDTCIASLSASTPSMKNWWRHWRDHLFYALSRRLLAPDVRRRRAGLRRSLPAGERILVDRYAAVVIFAGPALPGQQRRNNSDASLAENTADADRVVAANYLEHRNLPESLRLSRSARPANPSRA
jgi:hypothetical protein